MALIEEGGTDNPVLAERSISIWQDNDRVCWLIVSNCFSSKPLAMGSTDTYFRAQTDALKALQQMDDWREQ